MQKHLQARGAGDRGCDKNSQMIPLSAASRTRIFFRRSVPGVPLRSTPGFMLLPRSAG